MSRSFSLRHAAASALTGLVLLFAAGCTDQQPAPLSPTALDAPAGTRAATVNPTQTYRDGAAVVLDAGAFHTCAYYPADGNVTCWTAHHYAAAGVGDDYLAGDAVGFDAGTQTNCVLLATGNTHCWGQSGELLSYDDGNAVQVAVAGYNACVVTADGTVKCTCALSSDRANNCIEGTNGSPGAWGTIYSGGDAEWIRTTSWAVCVNSQAGGSTLTCQGWNSQPSWTLEGTPLPVGGGHYSMCLLTAEGDVECGYNGYHEWGQTAGYQHDEANPGTAAVDVSYGDDKTCYVTAAGDVNCMGQKPHTQTTNSENYTFTSWSVATGAVAVSVTGRFYADGHYDNSDICYADPAAGITCTLTTPDEYDAGPVDSDGDGVADDQDAFPNDPSEWADSDGDGVGDNSDPFRNSDLSATVVISGSDTGVANHAFGDGSTMSDRIGACAAGARNHGQWVSCVAKLTNEWQKSGLITGREGGAIKSAAARAKLP